MKRSTPRFIFRLLSPLDRAALVLNGKRHLPPLHLRRDVGPLQGFESSSAEFRVYLKLLAGLRPESRVLDVGCGCGQTALTLRDDLGGEGRYVGFDVSVEAIAWCRDHIAAHDERFSFHHVPLRNTRYAPKAGDNASEFAFPPAWGRFDVVLVKSVFTHLQPAAVRHYLGQIAGCLKDDGRLLGTFFLLNDEQRSLQKAGKNRISFQPPEQGVAVVNPSVPEEIIAFDESLLAEMMERAGLRLASPIRYGAWSGRPDGLSHQDIVLFERSGAARR